MRSNGSLSIVGKPAMVRQQHTDYLFAGYLIRLRPIVQSLVPKYLVYMLMEPTSALRSRPRPSRPVASTTSAQRNCRNSTHPCARRKNKPKSSGSSTPALSRRNPGCRNRRQPRPRRRAPPVHPEKGVFGRTGLPGSRRRAGAGATCPHPRQPRRGFDQEARRRARRRASTPLPP